MTKTNQYKACNSHSAGVQWAWTNILASYTGCSCYKIGDQGNSWLLKELLKKIDFLFPLLLACFPFRRDLCNGSSAWAGCVCSQVPAVCPPATSDLSCACMGQKKGLFLGQSMWPGRARDFTWLLPIVWVCIAVTQQTWRDSIKTVLQMAKQI